MKVTFLLCNSLMHCQWFVVVRAEEVSSPRVGLLKRRSAAKGKSIAEESPNSVSSRRSKSPAVRGKSKSPAAKERLSKSPAKKATPSPASKR